MNTRYSLLDNNVIVDKLSNRHYVLIIDSKNLERVIWQEDEQHGIEFANILVGLPGYFRSNGEQYKDDERVSESILLAIWNEDDSYVEIIMTDFGSFVSERIYPVEKDKEGLEDEENKEVIQ